MAKGQKRSTREAKKPKKTKDIVPTAMVLKGISATNEAPKKKA